MGRTEICLWLLQATFDSLLKIGTTLGLGVLRMLGKTPLWKDLLLYFTKDAKMTSLICFITFVGMLLGPVIFLILRSEIMNYVRYLFIS